MVKRISDMVKEQDIVVQSLAHYPDQNTSIKMEVGIEDCLHIEFEYNKSKYENYLNYIFNINVYNFNTCFLIKTFFWKI